MSPVDVCFPKKCFPIINLAVKPHHIVTLAACNGTSWATLRFSFAQIQQMCVITCPFKKNALQHSIEYSRAKNCPHSFVQETAVKMLADFRYHPVLVVGPFESCMDSSEKFDASLSSQLKSAY